MVAEKSHHVPSTGWRPREAGGKIQSECEDMRTRGVKSVNPSPGQQRRGDVPTRAMRPQFYSGPPQNIVMVAKWEGGLGNG